MGTPRRRGLRPSAATIVAALVLTAALAGTAIAGPDAITSALSKGKVKSIAAKQAKKQIKKQAPKLSVAEAASVKSLVPFGPVTVQEGAPNVTLASNGPLSLIASCDDDGAGSTESDVLVATTAAGTAFGGDDESGGDIGPATPASSRGIEDPGASSSGAPEHSDGYDDQFSIVAPNGKAMHGTVSSVADGGEQSCRYYGSVTIVK